MTVEATALGLILCDTCDLIIGKVPAAAAFAVTHKGRSHSWIKGRCGCDDCRSYILTTCGRGHANRFAINNDGTVARL